MPASMISAEVGLSVKVTGSNIAIVATGPMPGNTPISVPSITPIRQYRRFHPFSATLKPSDRFEKRDSMALLQDAGPDVHRQPESAHEREDREDRQRDSEDGHFLPPEFMPAPGA